jgi:hypothetical protein
MGTYRSAVRRTAASPSIAACILLGVAACLVALLAAAVIFIRPTLDAAPAQTSATVGGLHYSVNNAWVLHPRRDVEAGVAEGLPSSARRLGAHNLLYAVFVGVTNESGRRLLMASEFALRDTRNREFAPIRLRPRNAFAYRPRVMAPKTHRPAPWTAAGRDLAADGLMLVFRIPRRSYNDGPLELVVHDPRQPASVRTLQMA